MWTQIRLFIAGNHDKLDILFVPAGIIPVIPFKKYKIITTIHDVAFLEYPEYFSKRELLLQKLGLKMAILLSEKIITISDFSKQQIIKYTKCNPDRISVAYLGCDYENFRVINDIDTRNIIKEKYKLPTNFLLYVGRIEEKKNILNQIKAFQKLREKYPDYYFILMGKHGYGYNNIQNELKNNNLDKNVVELGWVSDNDISCIMNLALMFVYVTNYEGFGLPIIETQACGIPVITASNTCQKEIAEDSVLYSLPDDVNKIYENMLSIIEDKDIKDNLIRKGFENIKRFSWDKCAKETLEIFK